MPIEPEATDTVEDQAPTAQLAMAERTPRIIKRIVCAYRQESLPGDWLQTWRRLDRLVERSGFDIRVTLAPFEEMPEDTDIVVTSSTLRETAMASTRPGTPILVTTPAAAPAAFADLVRRLERGEEITAARIDPEERATRSRFISYRGQTRLE